MFRKKRLLLVFLVLVGLYLVIRYLPTHSPAAGQTFDSRTGRSQGRPVILDLNSKNGAGADSQAATGVYDGPVKFYNLASSLRPHMYRKDHGKDNILFILYDLRSAPSLVGLACETALYNRTTVHLGLVSMQDTAIDEIMAVSGIKMKDCPIFWHDARPDYNKQSSPAREAIVIKSALSHIHVALKPTVVLLDQDQANNAQLKAAMQEKLDQIWTPLLILPSNAINSMSWVTTLNGRALALLNQNQIEILISPYKSSAGSLIRLLESIKHAHYSGLPLPRITVELPRDTDSFALRYLQDFRWPSDNPAGQSRLTLRRQISAARLGPSLAAIRILESFYPPTQAMSHVLVLSADAELSPIYLHYLYYLALEYKCGEFGERHSHSLMGISLDLPKEALNDIDPFIAGNADFLSSAPLLLSQTPSSVAALYFGDKWVELQDYLTSRLKHDPDLSETIQSAPQASADHPAWLTQALELMRIRNNYMLYPSFASNAEKKLVTVHTESHQAPEEFWTESKKEPEEDIPSFDEATILTAEHESPLIHANMPHGPQSQHLLSIPALLGLEERDLLPALSDVPLTSAVGQLTDWNASQEASEAYADKVSLELGGCKTTGDRDDELMGTLEYLFCP